MSGMREGLKAAIIEAVTNGDLSEKDLTTLFFEVKSAVRKRSEDARIEAQEKIKALAEQAGLSVTIKTPAAQKQSEAKYAHDGKSWTGKGRQPRWLRQLLAAGFTLEDLAV